MSLKFSTIAPTPLSDVNLSLIPQISHDFDCLVGLSDHTEGHLVAVGAIAFGAKVIEKHFIIDRSFGGPDSAFSMEPDEFLEMVTQVRSLEKAIGVKDYKLSSRVVKNKQFARSLFVVNNVKIGDLITKDKLILPDFEPFNNVNFEKVQFQKVLKESFGNYKSEKN